MTKAKLVSQLRSSLNEDGYHISHSKEDPAVSTFLHYHDYYEIMLYFGSEPMTMSLSGRDYLVGRGAVTFVDIFETHEFKGNLNSENERICLGIAPELLINSITGEETLLSLFKAEDNQIPVFNPDIWSLQNYTRIIQDLLCRELNHGDKIRKKALILELLAYLYNDRYIEKPSRTIDSHRIEIVSSMIQYVDNHLAEKLSLSALAKAVNYSESYIGRIFKEVTNQSFTSYIINKRLIKASSYLREGYPATEASQMVGFHNYSYFFKTFKKAKGISPMEYKREF